MADKTPKKSVNKLIIAITSAVVAIAAIVVVAFVVINGNDNDDDNGNVKEEESKKILGYEANVIANEDDDIQGMVDDMMQKAEEGNISLEYKNMAYSTDGEKFTCYIANATKNNYDFFLALYEDNTFKNELYLSGLIPVGSAIEGFTINEKLEKGEHSMVLAITQVEDDHETMRSQVLVQITLVVK